MLLPSLCEEWRRQAFIIQLAEMQNRQLNSPLCDWQPPHPCRRGHKEDLTSVLRHGHCWDQTAPAGDPPSRLQGRWERLSTQSHTGDALLCTGVCVYVWKGRCPRVEVPRFAPCMDGGHHRCEFSSRSFLPVMLTYVHTQSRAAKPLHVRAQLQKRGSTLRCPTQTTDKFSGVKLFPFYM